MSPPVFPFSAIVGQDLMKKALALTAINPRIGGVLIKGEKGTAKSTAVRAFAALLPDISVVAGCTYSCGPGSPTLCSDCGERAARGESLPATERPVRVVDLPLGATEDRLVGTLDLERAIQEGRRAFQPGLLAAANRGILYVDEVNLLGDHLVDVLLDAAAMGRNYVERESVSIAHPAEFILIGTMNPEEGDLRPQLLDRFSLAVDVRTLAGPEHRAEAVRRRIAFEADPAGFGESWEPQQRAERERILAARSRLSQVRVGEEMLSAIVRLCTELGVDGLRGDIVMYKAASALAAYDGREDVSLEDVREAAKLALLHRQRRGPFDDAPTDGSRIDQILDSEDSGAGQEGQESPNDPQEGGGGPGGPDRVIAPDAPPPTESPLAGRAAFRGLRAGPAGRRAGSLAETPTGAYVRARPAAAPLPAGSLALDATLRAAAPLQPYRRRSSPDGPALRLFPSDLHQKVRHERARDRILFLVDASGSMAAQRRMAAVKGALLALLTDSYQKRDQVGLIAFKGDRASIALPFTNSVALAERRLRELPTGGRTPLAAALHLATETVTRGDHGLPNTRTWVVLVSDGRCNVPLRGGDPIADALAEARRLAGTRTAPLVIDTEPPPLSLGVNRAVAAALGARYLRLEALTAPGLAATVRGWRSQARAGGPGPASGNPWGKP